ncbi:MAG TPA: hypothetical protein VF080_10685 [Solirubrobacteraceae bacterium]
MTRIVTTVAALAAIGALAVSAAFASSSEHSAPRTAIVIDAPAARDGRALVDSRLRAVDADVRLPRDGAEARTDIRYFAAQGYDRIVVAGPRSTAAAHGAAIVPAADLPAALAAATR